MDNLERERGIYCNRTLNLRTVKAIGYDMDYTLVHYNVKAWEGKAYEYTKSRLLKEGWPVDGLTFSPELVTRGLVVDMELGNIVKANRFGYIKRALHGTKVLAFKEMRVAYSHTLVSLSESRYYFLNTLFSLSEGCIYAQLVDLFDKGLIPDVLTYRDLFLRIRKALDSAHIEGELKNEIMSDPARYVFLDPEMPLALLDQKYAGKKLMLITNSGWEYTQFMMNYACNPYLPDGMKWQDLFHVVVVSARKPDFFTGSASVLEVVNEEGMLRPVMGELQPNKCYWGGHAGMIEKLLGVEGDEILYVGDHIFGDVNVSKSICRWRTALILRELEKEVRSILDYQEQSKQINKMMIEKEKLEDVFSLLRLESLRNIHGYTNKTAKSREDLEQEIMSVRDKLVALDDKIKPLVREQGAGFNKTWGFLLRTGNDKSHLTRQLERYADIYTSRVSNFLRYTPYVYFRSPRGSLPHDAPF